MIDTLKTVGNGVVGVGVWWLNTHDIADVRIGGDLGIHHTQN